MPFNELIIYVYVVYLSGYISVADWLNNYGRVTPQHSPWINGLLPDSAKPLPLSVLTYHQLDTQEHISVEFQSKIKHFHSRKYIWKCCLPSGSHFVQASCDQLFRSAWHVNGTYYWVLSSPLLCSSYVQNLMGRYKLALFTVILMGSKTCFKYLS